MITVRKSQDRGHFNHGWLESYHTFSFADYYDPKHRHFRALRVINEDFVQAGKGFETHSHNDMEILTYVLSGELEHRDSMGTGSILKYGDIQRMTAGTGVTHSEKNPSQKNALHLLQIWIFPEQKDLTPSYEEKNFSTEDKKNQLRLIASQGGKTNSVCVHQDVSIYASILEANKKLLTPLTPRRYYWLQVARGALTVNGISLSAGDGAALSEESSLEITASLECEECEFLFFDLA